MFESCLGEKDPRPYPASQQFLQAETHHGFCGEAYWVSYAKQHSLPGVIKCVLVLRRKKKK